MKRLSVIDLDSLRSSTDTDNPQIVDIDLTSRNFELGVAFGPCELVLSDDSRERVEADILPRARFFELHEKQHEIGFGKQRCVAQLLRFGHPLFEIHSSLRVSQLGRHVTRPARDARSSLSTLFLSHPDNEMPATELLLKTYDRLVAIHRDGPDRASVRLSAQPVV
jgi:hypothetical protein